MDPALDIILNLKTNETEDTILASDKFMTKELKRWIDKREEQG